MVMYGPILDVTHNTRVATWFDWAVGWSGPSTYLVAGAPAPERPSMLRTIRPHDPHCATSGASTPPVLGRRGSIRGRLVLLYMRHPVFNVVIALVQCEIAQCIYQCVDVLGASAFGGGATTCKQVPGTRSCIINN